MAKRHDHRSIHASPPLRSPTNWMKAFLFLKGYPKTTHRAWATRAWQEARAGLSVDGARALRIHRPALVMTGVFCTLLVGFGSLDGMACASSMDGERAGGSCKQNPRARALFHSLFAALHSCVAESTVITEKDDYFDTLKS